MFNITFDDHGINELLGRLKEEAVGGGEGMAEVAAVAVGAGVTGEDHAADLGLVAGMADNGPELCDAVGKLAVLAVGALPILLPLVAQLGLEHSLVVHLQLQSFPTLFVLLSTSFPLPFALPAHVNPLLLPLNNSYNTTTATYSYR